MDYGTGPVSKQKTRPTQLKATLPQNAFYKCQCYLSFSALSSCWSVGHSSVVGDPLDTSVTSRDDVPSDTATEDKTEVKCYTSHLPYKLGLPTAYSL